MGLLVREGYEVSLKCVPDILRHANSGGYDMKKLVLAAALTAAASTATAGSLAEPVIEAPVIVEETGSSSNAIWLPIALLVLVGAAIAAN